MITRPSARMAVGNRGTKPVLAGWAKVLRPILYICLGAVILMAPAVLNRSPFLFYDTSHYLEFGRSIAVRLPFFRNLTRDQPASNSAEQVSIGEDKKREHPSLSYAGGRSPYYSFFIYVLAEAAGLWSVVCVQALLAATLLWITYALATPALSAIQFLLSTTVLSAASSLSFYICMIMPDIFAGFALLALGLLTLGFDGLSIRARIALVVFIAAAACTHVTIPVVCSAFVAFIVATQLLLNRRFAVRRWNILVWAMAGLVCAAFGSVVFSVASKSILGDTPQSPPYLMARVLADGTGRAYLHDACHPSSRYFLCKFEDRKFRDQDDFLWDGNPAIGVFSVSDYETRKRLKAEELSFVVGTITQYPVWQAEVSAKHWVLQLVTFGLSEFGAAKRSWDSMAFATAFPELKALYELSLAYQGYFPFKLFDWLQEVTVIISIVWLVVRFSSSDVRAGLRSARVHGPNVEALLVTSGIGLSGALLVNAAVCGIFSGVNDRYQARLVWLVPALAILALMRLRLAPSRRFRRSGCLVTATLSVGDDPSSNRGTEPLWS